MSLVESSSRRYLVILDVGSTYLKCTTYRVKEFSPTSINRQDKIKFFPEAMATVRIGAQPTISSGGAAEINPDDLLARITQLMKDCMAENQIHWNDVISVGITCQRNTFLIWNAKTESNMTPFFSWKDLRGDVIATIWNESCLSQLVRTLGKSVSKFVSWNRTLVMSAIYFRPTHILTRLSWMRQKIAGVQAALADGSAHILALDSWLLKQLTGNKEVLTDYSSVSSWGFFNPGTFRWSRPMLWVFRVPRTALPKVCSTTHNFGTISPKLFGIPVSISTMIADQQAAGFGHCLTRTGQCKLTLGTGAFLGVNPGSRLLFSNEDNIYTIIGWKLSDSKPVYFTETAVEGYTDILARCAAGGVSLCFQPDTRPNDLDSVLFSYLENTSDEKMTSQNGEAIGALVEIASLIAARVELLNEYIALEHPIRVDGGLSNSDLLMRCLATLLGQPVVRARNSEMTSFGAALLTGIQAGLWTPASVEEMYGDCSLEYKLFQPGPQRQLRLLTKHCKERR